MKSLDIDCLVAVGLNRIGGRFLRSISRVCHSSFAIAAAASSRTDANVYFVPNVSRHTLPCSGGLVRTTPFGDRIVIAFIVSIGTTTTIMTDRLCTIAANFARSAK